MRHATGRGEASPESKEIKKNFSNSSPKSLQKSLIIYNSLKILQLFRIYLWLLKPKVLLHVPVFDGGFLSLRHVLIVNSG